MSRLPPPLSIIRASWIDVPPDKRDVPFDSFWMSGHLTGVLMSGGWKRVGDLHGRTFAELPRPCMRMGAKALSELHELLAGLGAVRTPPLDPHQKPQRLAC